MASLTFVNGNNGARAGGWRISYYDGDRRKKSFWLGAMKKRAAEKFKDRLEDLIGFAAVKSRPDSNLLEWVAGLEDKFRERLENLGLIEPCQGEVGAPQTLGELVADYTATRASLCDRSIEKLGQAFEYLQRHFGETKKLRQFTQADGLRFREWCLTKGRKIGKAKSGNGISEACTRKYCSVARQLFSYAIRGKLVSDNPFSTVPCASIANPERHFFVTQEVARQVIDFAPNAEWRAIIAFSRFGGLRLPSELSVLRWADVDLASRRMTIRSPKTGVRICPIFPELFAELDELATQAQPGFETSFLDLVCPSCSGIEKNLRTGMMRILKKAGVAPWPRLFHGMRASRQTELLATFPAKDVCSWLGNSQPVAMAHYAMSTTQSFDLATGILSPGCSTSCSTTGDNGGLKADHQTGENAENAENSVLVGCGDPPLSDESYARRDSNPRPAD
jgi:integrase